MKFDYEAYKAKQEEKKEAKTTTSEWPALQFATTFLKKDGDSIVVRFPYHTPADFHIEHCHEVAFPGSPYPQKVECTKESGSCVLCDENVKTVDRFLVKAVVYIIKDNKVELFPVVWDRPFGYAKELENKMNEYGDLSEHLFKIKRNGTGTSTTYSTDIVLNKTVYNPDVYKADFSCLEHLEVDKILVRRMSKYLDLINPNTEEEVNTVSEVESTSEEREDPTLNRPKRHYQ
jgi:hypothetical protein